MSDWGYVLERMNCLGVRGLGGVLSKTSTSAPVRLSYLSMIPVLLVAHGSIVLFRHHPRRAPLRHAQGCLVPATTGKPTENLAGSDEMTFLNCKCYTI